MKPDKFRVCQNIFVKGGYRKGSFGMVSDINDTQPPMYYISFPWGGGWEREEDIIPDTQLARALYT